MAPRNDATSPNTGSTRGAALVRKGTTVTGDEAVDEAGDEAGDEAEKADAGGAEGEGAGQGLRVASANASNKAATSDMNVAVIMMRGLGAPQKPA